MNRSMNNRWVCGISGVWLAAMVQCLGSLPCVVFADEQDVGEATAPPLAVAPFDAAAAKAHQEAWAKHLGVPVEVTNSIGIKLVLIPPGEFLMGSSKEEEEMDGFPPFFQLLPQCRVRITKPFFLGMYEVTQSQWERVMGSNPSLFKGPQHPVEMVSWNDCQEFIRRLNDLPTERGGLYRLPTEAEWEYACRAGTTTAYSFDDSAESLDDYAWYGRPDGSTHPVGKKRPNAWGLFDMHGNVREWCQDWLGPYSQHPVQDPQGPTKGSYRVTRGGDWYDRNGDLRSAYRGGVRPLVWGISLGFRLARSSVDASGR